MRFTGVKRVVVVIRKERKPGRHRISSIFSLVLFILLVVLTFLMIVTSPMAFVILPGSHSGSCYGVVGQGSIRNLTLPGSSWPLLVPPGSSWLLLAPPGSSWLLLASPGSCWLLLAQPGSSWLLLPPPGSCWLLLAFPVSSWLLLAPPSYSLIKGTQEETGPGFSLKGSQALASL
jgi:hypothetical protein